MTKSVLAFMKASSQSVNCEILEVDQSQECDLRKLGLFAR